MFRAKNLRLWPLACVLLLLCGRGATACSGRAGIFNFHPASEYWSTEFVFSGAVTDISERVVEYVEGDHKGTYAESIARFTIEENFRGATGETIEVVSGQRSACTYEYRRGERYFVYAYRTSDGKVRASVFSRTRPLASATEDIAYARDMAGGEKGARIVGLVQRLSAQDGSAYGRLTQLPSVQVAIEGVNGQRWEVMTDARGQFEVRGAPPGVYVVRARLAENLRVSKFEEKIYIEDAENERFAGVLFTASSLASIGGRALDHEGKPIRSLMIDLLPVLRSDDASKSSLPVNTLVTDEEGRYEFGNVAPGSYLLAVNPANHVGRGMPAYARSYYPGRSSAAQARVITVKENQTLLNDDFLLPPPLKERTFAGTVSMPDGTPVSGARVSLVDANDKGPTSNTSVQTDESGHFVVKGYESYSYWLDAALNPDNSSRGPDKLMFAPAIKPPSKGDVPELRLVISSPIRVPPGSGVVSP
jgi:hypothetical protein